MNNKIDQFIDIVETGSLDAVEIVRNFLINYLSPNEALDFIEGEYPDLFESTDEYDYE